jgi:hypothetical protein
VRDILRITGIPVLLASLCCLSPIVLVLLGLTTTTFAASLSDTLYGGYRWVFRLVGLLALALSIAWHLRKRKNICTLDQARREKRVVINSILVSVIVAVLGYIFWLYVVVELIGRSLALWK